MEHLFSDNWVITIIGGALATLFAGLIAAAVSLFRPSISSLYKRALIKTCKDLTISPSDSSILKKALKNSAVEEAIKTRASNPGEEARLIAKAIESLASSTSQLRDPNYTASVLGQLLENEFRMEGTEEYHLFHDRNRDRRPYFEPSPAPSELRVTAVSQQVTLVWNASTHPSVNDHIWRYHIARSTNPNGPFTTEIATVLVEPGNVLSFTDQDLINGTIYYYVVTAESKLTKRGIPSTAISATPNFSPLSQSTTLLAPLVSSSADPSSLIPAVGNTFFTPLENLHDRANKCIGREREIDQLYQGFTSANYHLFLIEGFGGLGKTTLASRFAITISLRHTIVWIDGAGIPPTGERFLREMGKLASNQYHYPFLSAAVEDYRLALEEKEKALLTFLNMISNPKDGNSRQPIAFFFDDFHLIEDTILKQLVMKIAESHVNSKVVLMLRYLPSELQRVIDSLSNLQLEGLSPEDCRKVIDMYSNNYPALNNLDDEQLQKIREFTGHGVPSALRIFIAMTRKLTVNDVFEELPSLTAATRENWFGKLFHELSTDEQLVATEVSIFRRPTSRNALMYISRSPKVKEVIESLVDRFIITFDGKQYSMHALWSYYAGQYLSTTDAKILHQKAADFYRQFVSKDRYTEIMSLLESCYHHIQAAAMEQAETVLLSIASTLRAWGFFQEFNDILVHLEQDARDKKRSLALQLLVEKSCILYANGDVNQAINDLKRLVEQGSNEVKIRALSELGWIYTETGNRREAEQLLTQSRSLAHLSKRPDLEEEALYKLQEIAYHRSEYKKALEYDQQRLRILEQMENDSKATEAIANTYHNIGNIYRERGYYDEALEYYQRYLPFWQELGNPYNHTGWLTYNIGETYRDQGKLREAMEQFQIAFQIFHKMQYIYGIAHVKIELGRVGVKLGPPNIAINHVLEAIDILRRINGKSGEAYALAALGEMYLHLGKLDLAFRYLQDSMLIEQSLDNIKERARSLCLISIVHEQQGQASFASGKYTTESCSQFTKAAEAIQMAKVLFSEIDATPNIYDIKDAEIRIQRKIAECENAMNSSTTDAKEIEHNRSDGN